MVKLHTHTLYNYNFNFLPLGLNYIHILHIDMHLFNTIKPPPRQYIPTEIINCHIPILGDGSALLSLLERSRIKNTIYASDTNYKIIKLYRDIQCYPDEFLKGAEIIYREYAECPIGSGNRKPASADEAKSSTESYYYWIQTSYNNLCRRGHDSVLMSVLYLLLNNTSDMQKGGHPLENASEFSRPFGHRKTHEFYSASDITAISVLIQSVVFQQEIIGISLALAKPGDFVYLELPEVKNRNAEPSEFMLNMFKACKQLPCNFLLNSPEITALHKAFPLGSYEIKRVECGSNKVSVIYRVLVCSNYSRSESGKELSIVSSFLRPI